MKRRIPYRLQEGSWQPARLRWIDHAVMMILLIILAFTRGVDYLVGDDRWSAKDFMMNAAPEWVWGGVGFVTGAAILSAGVCMKRHLLVYIGHGWLGCSYGVTALALGIASGPEPHPLLSLLVGAGMVTLAGIASHLLASRGWGSLALALILATVAGSATAISLADGFDGIRSAASVGLVAYIHFINMVRTGGRPLKLEESHRSEQVIDGGSGA